MIIQIRTVSKYFEAKQYKVKMGFASERMALLMRESDEGDGDEPLVNALDMRAPKTGSIEMTG